jgi:transcriptional regulator with PAS, ATPase and Fis domain
MGALLRYHWPGNVRELENSLERAAVMCDGATLDLEQLTGVLRFGGNGVEAPHTSRTSLRDAEQDHILRVLEQHDGNRTHAARALGISLRTLHYRLKAIHQMLPLPAGRHHKINGRS